MKLVLYDCVEVSMAANPAGKRLHKCSEIPPLPRIPPFPGSERSVPRRAPLHALRSPLAELGIGGNYFAGDTETGVWGGRDTVLVPRAVMWRTVDPMPTGAYWDRHFFKDPFGHRHHDHRHHHRGALYNKDI